MFPIITSLSVRLGVVGAGVMGSGIALAALLSDMHVTLYDVSEPMLDRAREQIEGHLAKKGKTSILSRLTLTGSLEELQRCNFVIEAVPEDLALKADLFARLDALCPPPAVLATNTSTLSVTSIAAAAGSPARVAGMHFFNPAAVLPLVEVIRGAQTNDATLQTVAEVARRMGKTPVIAGDTPGFIVNRAARPFYGEALRLVGENAATFDQIDAITRLGAGFKMGPFELMDLIGIDINLAAMRSLWEQTYGEPRYRPHFIQVRMVQQGLLGRKTGRGFYDYSASTAGPSQSTPDGKQIGKGEGRVYYLPEGLEPGIAGRVRRGGYQLTALPASGYPIEDASETAIAILCPDDPGTSIRDLTILERGTPTDMPILCDCTRITAAELAAGMDHPERLVGFDGLFFADGQAATFTSLPLLAGPVRRTVENFAAHLGSVPFWVEDTPGLILARIVSMLVNEAAFAAGDGVAEPDEIDRAMQLGVSYPHGPLAWGRRLGLRRVLSVLDHLHAEYGDDRYRAAPLLRRWERLERIV